MFVVSGKKENAWAIKSTLKLFELISGLKVNFDKSCILGIGLENSIIGEAATTLSCKVSELPICYLGIKVGARFSRKCDWKHLGEKIRKRISGWSINNLSFAGRLTLVRSVLLSLPVYQLSFAKIPRGVITEIRSYLCKFLWGGGTETRKIPWIKWEELCKDMNLGGLGIKDLESFNIALVSKWLWRYINADNLLWAKIIRDSQGELDWDGEGFKVKGSRGPGTGWWKKILSLSRGEGGKWIRENLILQVGEGSSILFWKHRWTGEKNLAEEFPRLFHLSPNQEGFIKDMWEWVQGNWEWKLKWNRELLGRETDQVAALVSKIGSFRIVEGKKDGWQWTADARGQYSVKSAYQILNSTTRLDRTNEPRMEWRIIWKAPAPFKAITTGWKVLKGRVATCENLRKRQVAISDSEALCCFCKSTTETLNHLFFECSKTERVWKEILVWGGLQSALHHNAREHLLAFINLGCKEECRLLTGIWICVIWCIWKKRNECKFNQGVWCGDKLISEIKSQMWSWRLAFKMQSSDIEFRRWRSDLRLGG